jgi:hypothetical protein
VACDALTQQHRRCLPLPLHRLKKAEEERLRDARESEKKEKKDKEKKDKGEKKDKK